MIRARSCWRAGGRDWISGTVFDHTWRNETNDGGQFSGERSIGVDDDDDDLIVRGSGTDGGFVVHRSAAK